MKYLLKIKDESSIIGIIDNMVYSLIELSNNIGKDIELAFNKEKSTSIKEIAQAVLLGNKKADWVGIVGLLDPQKSVVKKDIKYKFSKKNYIDSVNKVTGLKQKQDVANKFFDGLQKDIQNELNKNFTDDEIKVIYDEAKKRSGEKQIGYPELKKLFDNKKPVIYLLKGKSIDDWNNLSNKQKRNYNERPASSIVGTSVISSIDDKNQNDSVVFKLSDGSETKKSYSQIIGPLGGDNVDKAKAILGEIKDDNDKMGNIVKFAQFLKTNTDDSKISEIDKIISKA